MRYLAPAFKAIDPDIDLRYEDDLGCVADIEAALCWHAPAGVLARLSGLRLVQSIGAGVDHILEDPFLPRHVPICRVVDPEVAQGMAAYVTWATVHHQRHMGRYLESAAAGHWQEQPIRSPRRHTVGIAGLGHLGIECARALNALGYRVRGWSRVQRAGELPTGVEHFGGTSGLAPFLKDCQTLICLLPLTESTAGFLCEGLFFQLPRGAHVINVGRGGHMVEIDLLRAVQSGQLGGATLDVFSQEPLPADHAFWKEPRILLTPHIASRSSDDVVARQTLDNLRAVVDSKLPAHQVDVQAGY